MSSVIIIILIALTALFVLLLILSIQRRRNNLFMAQDQQFVSGTVTEITTVRTGNNAAERVKICYTVNGKEYMHYCYSRPDKYHRDQTVNIIYHPNKPKLAYTESQFRLMPENDMLLLVLFLILMYIFAVCLVLSNVYDSLAQGFDCFELPMLLLFDWFSYWEEYKIIRRGISCKGTIVYAESDHKTVHVIAEFDVNGVTYETRMMNLPVKRRKREYNQGGQIGVLYREKNPAESAVEDDTLNEKFRRIWAVISSIVLSVLWLLLIFFF